MCMCCRYARNEPSFIPSRLGASFSVCLYTIPSFPGSLRIENTLLIFFPKWQQDLSADPSYYRTWNPEQDIVAVATLVLRFAEFFLLGLSNEKRNSSTDIWSSVIENLCSSVKELVLGRQRTKTAASAKQAILFVNDPWERVQKVVVTGEKRVDW